MDPSNSTHASKANIAVLAGLHGHELGWLCLGSCGADVRTAEHQVYSPPLKFRPKVIINAFALYWATGSHPKRKDKSPTVPSGIVSKDMNAIPELQYIAGASMVRTRHRSTVVEESQMYNPFAQPTFVPRFPETSVHISAGDPETGAKRHSEEPVFRRFLDRFRKQTEAEELPQEIQVTAS